MMADYRSRIKVSLLMLWIRLRAIAAEHELMPQSPLHSSCYYHSRSTRTMRRRCSTCEGDTCLNLVRVAFPILALRLCPPSVTTPR